MKIGTVIDDINARDSLKRGILAEELGFESLWFTDHLIDTGGIKVDPWATMGAIASNTTTINMCTCVTDTQRIHPAKLAHIVGTLGELSEGRAWLGIGAGEAMNIVPFGMKFDDPKTRTERLAESIQVAKLLWGSSKASPVSFQGKHFELENAWLDLEKLEPMPSVYVGALGGRGALEVAGKYGDGWSSWLNSPETYRKKVGIAREAAKSSGKDPEKFEACVWVYTLLTDKEEEIRGAVNRAKRGLLAEAFTLKMMGYDRPKELGKDTFQTMLVSQEVSQNILKAQDSIPDKVALDCIAAGNRSKIIDRIEEFQEAGATRAMIHFLKNEDGQVREFSDQVLSTF